MPLWPRRSLASQASDEPAWESPPTPPLGDDPDADAPELFYPAFYGDAPDAGGWIDSPSPGARRTCSSPTTSVVTTETYGIVDDALAELDPTDRSLLTLVDIDGVPFSQAVTVLDLASRDASERLARARLAVRGALDQYLRA